MTKPKPSFNFDKPLTITEKWVMGVSYIQVYINENNITEKKPQQYIPGYYEQERGHFENFKNLIKEKTPEYIFQIKKHSANKYKNELKLKADYGIEEHIFYLSDLNYETPMKNSIGGLKRMNYGRHYNDENNDMYYRMQLIIDAIEFILGYEYIDTKTRDYEIPPGIYELSDINNLLQICYFILNLKLMKNL